MITIPVKSRHQINVVIFSYLFAFAIVGIGSLFASVNANAEEHDALYLVDMQRIISESALGKAAKTSLEGEAKKRQAGLAAQKAELDKLKGELETQASVLSASATEEKRATLEKKAREFERTVQDQREELGRKQSAAIEKIVQQANQAINDLATKGKYKLILEKDSRVVLYSEPSLDITGEVLKAIDSKTKS